MSKIGILLPRSTYYSSIGFDLYQGIKSGLKKSGRDDITVLFDNIGFGTDQQQCYRIVERFLMQEEVSIVFAYISHRTAQLIRSLFLAANKILIVLDSGANLPQEWPESSNTLYHSLHNSLGCWLSAEVAHKDGNSKAAMVTGYYDGGYLQTHAFYTGFIENEGTIAYNHATGYTRDKFCIKPLQKWYTDQPEACFLSPFSGDFVQWYFEELKRNFKSEKPNVYLPPFGLEEMMLEETPFPDQNIRGIAAWYKSNELPENQFFCSSIEESGKKANLFSLLGWEAAILGAYAIDLMEKKSQNGREACRELLDFSFTGPRGKVSFHAKTKTSIAPLYQSSVDADTNGNCSLRIISEIPEELIHNAYEKMVNLSLENAISGWYNSYTCI